MALYEWLLMVVVARLYEVPLSHASSCSQLFKSRTWTGA
jgi:hypothetical protein